MIAEDTLLGGSWSILIVQCSLFALLELLQLAVNSACAT